MGKDVGNPQLFQVLRKCLIHRVQPVLLAAGLENGGRILTTGCKGKQIIFRPCIGSSAPDGVCFRLRQHLGCLGPQGAGEAGAPGVPLRVRQSALQGAESAHAQAHYIVILGLGGKAKEPAADLGQFLGDVGKILHSRTGIAVETALHLRHHHRHAVIPGIPLHGGIAAPAGTVIGQAVQQVYHRGPGQIARLRQNHHRAGGHVQGFRNPFTAKISHVFIPPQLWQSGPGPAPAVPGPVLRLFSSAASRWQPWAGSRTPPAPIPPDPLHIPPPPGRW